MRRRVKPWVGPLNVLAPLTVPFVDDESLPVKGRVRRYEEWCEKHLAPWQAARDEYEDTHGVVLIDSSLREFYTGPGFVFVDDLPRTPDMPWDPDSI